jgi:hypothetical protein
MMREEMNGKRLTAEEMDAWQDAAQRVQLRRWCSLFLCSLPFCFLASFSAELTGMKSGPSSAHQKN